MSRILVRRHPIRTCPRPATAQPGHPNPGQDRDELGAVAPPGGSACRSAFSAHGQR